MSKITENEKSFKNNKEYILHQKTIKNIYSCPKQHREKTPAWQHWWKNRK